MQATWMAAVATALFALLALPAAAGVERADFALTIEGPNSAKVGGRAVYEIALTNAGPDQVPSKVRINAGRGADDTGDGSALKTVSQHSSKGECNNDGLGVICRPGPFGGAETVKIEVAAKIYESLGEELAVQAIVEPETPELGTDPDRSNNYAATTTPIAKPITLDGVPESCAKAPFKVSVEVAIAAAERTKVIVDGKVVGKSANARLKATIKPGDLDKGSHGLSVVVQAGKGPPLATLKRKFKTC